jgi:4-amino-4-deoxy-L-arabinose transferase-like glycosyltransferase
LLTSVLRLAAGLRLWRRRSMASSWHNFLYASFDPAGFVSVDKPPLALWIYAGLLGPVPRAHSGERGQAHYLLATSSTTLAAPIIIQTGGPVR